MSPQALTPPRDSLRDRLRLAADRLELLGMGAVHAESHIALLREAAGDCEREPIELHRYLASYDVNGDPHEVEVCAMTRTEARRLVAEHQVETHGAQYAASMVRAWDAVESADRRIMVAPGDVGAFMGKANQ